MGQREQQQQKKLYIKKVMIWILILRITLHHHVQLKVTGCFFLLTTNGLSLNLILVARSMWWSDIRLCKTKRNAISKRVFCNEANAFVNFEGLPWLLLGVNYIGNYLNRLVNLWYIIRGLWNRYMTTQYWDVDFRWHFRRLCF